MECTRLPWHRANLPPLPCLHPTTIIAITTSRRPFWDMSWKLMKMTMMNLKTIRIPLMSMHCESDGISRNTVCRRGSVSNCHQNPRPSIDWHRYSCIIALILTLASKLQASKQSQSRVLFFLSVCLSSFGNLITEMK